MVTISIGGNRFKIPSNAKAENLITCLKEAKGRKCVCGKAAVYSRRQEGRAYCKDCFSYQIERRFKRAVRKYGLIQKGDCVAVALSGSKDSSVLLYLLSELSKAMPFGIVAITADEGIRGYRPRGLKFARALCMKLKIPHHTVSFKDQFGFTMDGLAKRLVTELPWCSWCGVLRRRALNNKARELGCNKLAVGHTLDDEVQSIMLGMIRGDRGQFSRLGFASGTAKSEKWVQRIKPLREIPEAETALYALLHELPFSRIGCPHSSEVMRKHVRSFLNDMETRYPGTKHRILRFYDKLRPIISDNSSQEVGSCRICGEPSSGNECRVCEMVAKAKGIPKSDF